MTLQERLSEMRKIADAATEGPWEVKNNGYWSIIGENTFCVVTKATDADGDAELITRDRNTLENAEFIAESRTMMPRLIEALELAIKQRDSEIEAVPNFDTQEDEDAEFARLNKEIERILKGEE